LGPKHSGKTTVGRVLAGRLNLPFFDLDALIEERCGKNPETLYREGQEVFHREEAAALASLLQKDALEKGRLTGVLATGGGIIDNPGTLDILRKLAVLCKSALLRKITCASVYLELSAKTAWNRIIGKGELPPFLNAETPKEAKENHRIFHERRARGYKELASFCVTAEGKNPRDLAAEIAALLERKQPHQCIMG
jgi:shikimate kinase